MQCQACCKSRNAEIGACKLRFSIPRLYRDADTMKTPHNYCAAHSDCAFSEVGTGKGKGQYDTMQILCIAELHNGIAK